MTKNGIRTAVAEAKRFIASANLALNCDENARPNEASYLLACKENGAVRRASMDLTRALTQMRQQLDLFLVINHIVGCAGGYCLF